MQVEEIEHYVCAGECKTVSEKPGNCYSADCSHYGQAFQSCDCTDGKHAKIWQKEKVYPTDENDF